MGKIKGRIHRYLCVKLIFLLDNLYNSIIKKLFKPEKIKKILFIHPRMIGDVVIATPGIKALKDRFPKAEISIVVTPLSYDIIKKNPSIDKIFLFEEGRQKLLDYISFIKRIRKEKFDLTIDTQISFLTLKRTLISFLSKANHRVNFKRGGFRGFLPTIEVDLRLKHGAEYYLDLVKAVGAIPHDKRFQVFISEKDEGYIKDIIKDQIKNKFPIIGIHAGNQNLSKRWRDEKFAKVSDTLNEKFKANIVLIGSSNDKKQIDGMIKYMKTKPLDLVGRTTVAQLCALIKNLDLLISIDTSSIHIAAATNTPTVGIYGPSYLMGWTPWNKQNQICITNYHKCKECKDSINYKELLPDVKCTKENMCIATIEIKKVIDSAMELLKK
ncbi:glycosyltransferase family 9 protein [bacterium]|nr:glycosyltransferase family 9 protein [bacterium]